MDGQYFWKRTEETEIDLADLLRRLCTRWKQITVCALVCAVILGGYGWMKGMERPEEDRQDLAESAVLTETEAQAVADAVRLEHETRELETYLDHSILMQLDPYHKARQIMLYSIEHAARQELPAITESYLNFAANGGAAQALTEYGDWDIERNYLAEVISAYQKTYSSPYQLVADNLDSSLTAESLFYVEITGRDAKEAAKMAQDMQAVLEEYAASVRKTAGNHRLKLVSCEENITIDSGLQSQQHDKRAQLSSNRTSLKAATDAFSKEQMAVYEDAAGMNADGTQEGKDRQGEELSDAAVSGRDFRLMIKYIILGLAGGMFLYCCAYSCWYIFCDAVKSVSEMKRLYTFPVFGGISFSDRGSEQKQAGRRAGQDGYGQTVEQVQNRIRLACQKQGISKLCAVSDFALGKEEKACLENMAQQLKRWNVDMTVVEKAGTDTAAWDGLAETGNVLAVIKTGITTHRMIDDAMNFYTENGITAAGAVVFSKDKS